MADDLEAATAQVLSPVVGVVATIAFAAVWTVVNYVAWLGWDQHPDVGPTGQSGPYQLWQGAGIALALAAVAAILGWRGQPFLAAAVMALMMCACFSVDVVAVGPSEEAPTLWPIGAVTMLLGVYAGTGIVAYTAWGLSPLRKRSASARTGYSPGG